MSLPPLAFWKRTTAILFCLGLLVTRLIWPRIQLDIISIWLIVIASIYFFIPDPQSIFSYIKRIKLWAVEIELKEEIKELGREVAEAKGLDVIEPANHVSQNHPEVDEVMREVHTNPRASFILLSSKIEYHLRKRLQEVGLLEEGHFISIPDALQLAQDNNMFSPLFYVFYRHFWKEKDKAVNDIHYDAQPADLSMIGIGLEMLEIVSGYTIK